MRPPVWAVVSSVTGLVALCAGWLVGGALQPAGRYDPVRQTISVLAGRGAADRGVMLTALFLVGAGHLVTAAGLRGLRTSSRMLLAMGGVAGLGLTLFAEPAHGTNSTHIGFAAVGVVVMAVWPVTVAVPGARRFPLAPRHVLVAAVVSGALLAWMLLDIHGRALGLAERACTLQQTAWPLLVVLALRRERPVRLAPSATAPADTMSR